MQFLPSQAPPKRTLNQIVGKRPGLRAGGRGRKRLAFDGAFQPRARHAGASHSRYGRVVFIYILLRVFRERARDGYLHSEVDIFIKTTRGGGTNEDVSRREDGNSGCAVDGVGHAGAGLVAQGQGSQCSRSDLPRALQPKPRELHHRFQPMPRRSPSRGPSAGLPLCVPGPAAVHVVQQAQGAAALDRRSRAGSIAALHAPSLTPPPLGAASRTLFED